MANDLHILLTGKNGQVGFELTQALAPLGKVTAVDYEDFDFSDANAIRRMVTEIKPQVIVNPAAYTAVDKAEAEPDLARAINAIAPGIMGEEAARIGALVVHYSTDYVFDGQKEGWYLEVDRPNPLNVYGRTKLAGEQALVACGARHLIFRTSWVFGSHGHNFIKTILRLAGERTSLNIVADQFGAPTPASLIAEITARVLKQWSETDSSSFPYGLYNLTAAGQTNWHEYACAIIETAQAAGWPLSLGKADVKPISTAEYPTPAIRPANSCLDTTLLRKTFGVSLPDWRQGLQTVLEQLLRS